MTPAVRFAYADTTRGQVHYASCGRDAPAVLLLHQTPRSWDEYREVLPLLGRTHRSIAMDTIGFGRSAPAPDHSIETYADVAVEFAQVLGLARVTVVGHHTGALVAIEVAVRAPGLVSGLVLSSAPYYDAAARAKSGHKAIDDAASARREPPAAALAEPRALLSGGPAGPAAPIRVRRAGGGRRSR